MGKEQIFLQRHTCGQQVHERCIVSPIIKEIQSNSICCLKLDFLVHPVSFFFHLVCFVTSQLWFYKMLLKTRLCWAQLSVPGMESRTLRASPHLIHTRAPEGRSYHHPHFIDEETEARIQWLITILQNQTPQELSPDGKTEEKKHTSTWPSRGPSPFAWTLLLCSDH